MIGYAIVLPCPIRHEFKTEKGKATIATSGTQNTRGRSGVEIAPTCPRKSSGSKATSERRDKDLFCAREMTDAKGPGFPQNRGFINSPSI